MARDFGFTPSEGSDAYFISYNSGDSDWIQPIVYEMYQQGVPMWYDNGLAYGDNWEPQITQHVQHCKAVIMFITKNMFQREVTTYVYKEFKMAKDFSKKTYVPESVKFKRSRIAA